MRASLYKDACVLLRQAKIFLVIIVLFAVLGGTAWAAFATWYAALLPITALAYDERARWDFYAAGLPYTRRDLVLGKYVLSWVSIAAAAVLSLLGQAVVGLVRGGGDLAELVAAMPLIVVTPLLPTAVLLPVLFRYGVERGRMLFYGMIAAFAAVCFLLFRDGAGPAAGHALPLTAILIVAAVVGTAVSVRCSIRVYTPKRG